MADQVAILVEPEQFVEAFGRIAALVPDVELFTVTPILCAPSDAEGLDAVRTDPGVVGVAPLDDVTRRLLVGVDRIVANGVGLVDDWAVGGVSDPAVYPVAFGQPVGTAAPPGVCAAVNLSMGPADDAFAPTLPDDPVIFATRVLAQMTVPVVSAGNHHSADADFETVSPWAEPDWVLSVGATVDEAGTEEWAHSGRGSTLNPGVGPDILAWGLDPFAADPSAPGAYGTSFAAAAVSNLLVLTRAWLLQVAANCNRLSGLEFGVPLVGIAVLDMEFNGPPLWGPPQDWPALPVLGTIDGALDPFLDASSAPSVATSLAARHLLLAAARSTTPTPSPPLSAPSISRARLLEFLDGLGARRLAAILGDTEPPAGGADPPLFAPGTAETLQVMVEGSMPIWEWGVDTDHVRMRHPKQEIS